MTDAYPLSAQSNDGRPWVGNLPGLTVARASFDCAVVNRGANATVQAIAIPEKSLVLQVVVVCHTLEGGTLTIDIGDTGDRDGYMDAGNLNSSVGRIAGTANTPAALTGNAEFYNAANNLAVKFNNAADKAVFDVVALLLDCNVADQFVSVGGRV